MMIIGYILILEEILCLSLDTFTLVFSLFILRMPLQMRAYSMLAPFFINLKMVLGLLILSLYIKLGIRFSMHRLTCCSLGISNEH